MSHDAVALPPSASILGFVTGVWAAQAVATLARFGIPDLLALGPRTAPDLAKAVGADPSALYRLMRGAASVGVLHAETGGRFRLTPVGECLRKDVPGSMRSFLIAETSPGHWLPWGQFEESVRTGKPAAERVLGMTLWDYYKQHHEEGRLFAEAMSNFSTMAVEAVLASYSFGGARRVVDVGGSHGGFLSAVLARESGARGVLFDLPEVVAGARAALEAAQISGRVETVGGSFFDGVPAGGDVYLLKHILHDWNDDECVRILRNVRAAMNPEGRVVVVEMLITDAGPPSPAPLLDLNMMVMLSGRERTADEFVGLFAKAGLKSTRVVATPSPFAVLEARPA